MRGMSQRKFQIADGLGRATSRKHKRCRRHERIPTERYNDVCRQQCQHRQSQGQVVGARGDDLAAGGRTLVSQEGSPGSPIRERNARVSAHYEDSGRPQDPNERELQGRGRNEETLLALKS